MTMTDAEFCADTSLTSETIDTARQSVGMFVSLQKIKPLTIAEMTKMFLDVKTPNRCTQAQVLALHLSVAVAAMEKLR